VCTLVLFALIGAPAHAQESDIPVVKVSAHDFSFVAPDTIPSGWVTFRLDNKGEQIHEISLARLPDGKTHTDYMRAVIPVWEDVLDRIQAGELSGSSEAYAATKSHLPDWAAKVTYMKARGLASPDRRTTNTLSLEPGRYAMDCWVKTPDGEIHISEGMSRPLFVTQNASGKRPPSPDLEIRFANGQIQTEGPIEPGRQQVAVRFGETMDHDNVHLIRMEDDTNLSEVVRWIGWYERGELRAPAPAEFLGGTNVYGSVPRGQSAYFSVTLQPGERYTWVVKAPVDAEMWKTFTVPGATGE
jgi:hypothetical protein